MVPQLDDGATPGVPLGVGLGADHCGSFHRVAEDQLERLNGQLLVTRQGDSIPGLRDLAVGQQSRSQGYARHFEKGILNIVPKQRQIGNSSLCLEPAPTVSVHQGNVPRTYALSSPKADPEQRSRSVRQEVGMVLHQFRRPGITGVRFFDLDAVEIARSD